VSSVNLFHGLPLTRAERRRAVEVKLRIHPDWSDRRLAEGMAVGRELIAKVRRQLVESGQVPGDLGRIGSDGKTYSAGREPSAKAPKPKPAPPAEEPRERPAPPPWEEAAPVGPRAEVGDKKVAITPPGSVSVATINEMLEMMARQVMEVVTWTQAEGFTEAYRKASANARGLFQSASIKLAARADQLRRS
jgi:hypothetical protein